MAEADAALGVRELIHEILRETLSIEPPAADADLIDGGFLDSLAIVTLLVELEQRFSVALPLEHLDLASIRSIEALEALVAGREPGAQAAGAGAVQLMRAGSGGEPVFVFPGVWGKAIDVLPLIQSLSTSRPIYALQTWGSAAEAAAGQGRPVPAAESAAQLTVEALAARSLEAILAVEPHGPFTLVGYSFGGQVAFEVAGMLRARGRRVRLLTLVDTRVSPAALPPGAYVRFMLAHPARWARYILAEPRTRVPMYAGALRWWVRARAASAHMGPAPTSRQYDPVMLEIDAAGRAYRPRPYDGPAALLVTDPSHPRVSAELAVWRRMIAGLAIIRIPGSHKKLISSSAEPVAARIDRLRLEPAR